MHNYLDNLLFPGDVRVVMSQDQSLFKFGGGDIWKDRGNQVEISINVLLVKLIEKHIFNQKFIQIKMTTTSLLKKQKMIWKCLEDKKSQ